MFTGIVERTTPILQISEGDGWRRIVIGMPGADVRLGESIAVNGVCLTVAELADGQIAFDVIAESLAKTNLGRLRSGDSINLERSLRVGDRIDGHFVQGHVDGTATVLDVQATAGETRITAKAPEALAKYLVPKGSVCLDGTSLTIASVAGARFEVALIPTTLSITTLGSIAAGWPLNLEADIFTKTIVNTLERMRHPAED